MIINSIIKGISAINGLWEDTKSVYLKESTWWLRNNHEVQNVAVDNGDLVLEDDGGTYEEEGHRISKPLNLSLITQAKNSLIKFETETDEDTDVKIYTGIIKENTLEPIKLEPSDDAYVVDTEPNTNFGDEDSLAIGGWANFYLSGIRFDILNAPQKAKSAKIYIYRTTNQANPLASTRWRRIEEDWSEDTVTWNTKPTGMTNNSGDSVGVPSSGNWFILDITNLYNQWKDGTYDNYGIALNGNSSSYTNATTNFASKEYEIECHRPYLEIEPDPEWQLATNNDPITGIAEDAELTGKYLWCKAELKTEDTSKTPKLKSLEATITNK